MSMQNLAWNNRIQMAYAPSLQSHQWMSQFQSFVTVDPPRRPQPVKELS